MKNENLIHVKLEYGEALQSKKDVLSSEMNLLRIAGIIKKYRIFSSRRSRLPACGVSRYCPRGEVAQIDRTVCGRNRLTPLDRQIQRRDVQLCG